MVMADEIITEDDLSIKIKQFPIVKEYASEYTYIGRTNEDNKPLEERTIFTTNGLRYKMVNIKTGEVLDLKTFLYNIIRLCPGLTRSEINQLTSIPRTTIYDYIERLVEEDKVIKKSLRNRKRGRCKVMYFPA